MDEGVGGGDRGGGFDVYERKIGNPITVLWLVQ
jgi:hypothetical protein